MPSPTHKRADKNVRATGVAIQAGLQVVMVRMGAEAVPPAVTGTGAEVVLVDPQPCASMVKEGRRPVSCVKFSRPPE